MLDAGGGGGGGEGVHLHSIGCLGVAAHEDGMHCGTASVDPPVS
jgi:hypothetical protein